MEYEVGTHRFRQSFNCKTCAINFYNDLKEKHKYLMGNKKHIIMNTYGWG